MRSFYKHGSIQGPLNKQMVLTALKMNQFPETFQNIFRYVNIDFQLRDSTIWSLIFTKRSISFGDQSVDRPFSKPRLRLWFRLQAPSSHLKPWARTARKLLKQPRGQASLRLDSSPNPVPSPGKYCLWCSAFQNLFRMWRRARTVLCMLRVVHSIKFGYMLRDLSYENGTWIKSR